MEEKIVDVREQEYGRTAVLLRDDDACKIL
jgi:hypothetical protein